MRIADLTTGSTVVQPSSYNRITLNVESAVVVGDSRVPVLLHGTVQVWIGKKGRTLSGYNGGKVEHQKKVTLLSVVIDGVSHSINQTI